jgi:hypothetical protein
MKVFSQFNFSTLLLATVAVGVLPVMTQAATYYVSTTGSDGNTPVQAQNPLTPWRTLTASVPKLVCGDTLYVRGGNYTTESTILFNKLCPEDARITVMNYSNESPIVSWSDRQNPSNTVYFYKAPLGPTNIVGGITLQGIELFNGYNAVRVDNATRITIRNCGLRHSGENGILGFCLNCTVDRNRIYDNGDFTLPQCGNSPACNQFHGLYIAGMGWKITNNLIYDNLGYGIQTHGAIFDASRHPNNTYAAFSALIANNTLAYQRNRSGIVLWNETSGVQLAATIQNNVFYENSQSGVNPSGINITANGNVSGTIIKNNVHYATGVPTFLGGAPCTGCTITDNRTNENPNMVNAPSTMPASPDFNLKAGSVAIDQGMNLSASGVMNDFAGRVRPVGNSHDIGAFEFSNSAALAPPRNLKVQ